MNIIPVLQGSNDWLVLRATHLTASEASAAMGCSKYLSRTDLMAQKSTGITPEVNESTQALYDRGHEAEENARKFAERIIGEDLFPVTGTLDIDGLPLLASFDGISMDNKIIWEHKLFSRKLTASVQSGELDQHYTIQLDQQLLISGADKALFMVSDGTEENLVYCWYMPNQEKFKRLLAAWKQFNFDLTNYQHAEVIPAAIAAPIKDLPALFIQVNGAISLISNLNKFGVQLVSFIDQINKEPTDDQGFADAEAACKTLQQAQDALEAAEASALAQTADIDDMRRTVKLYTDTARTTRLMLEKMVKGRKESIRFEIIQAGKDAGSAHLEWLNKRLGKPYMPAIVTDFALATKGKRTIASLRDAVDTELSRMKIGANALADKIQINLNSLHELAKDYAFLFADTGQIVLKENDDLVMLIKSRIAEQKQDEADKLEAQRVRIQAEEETKAKAAQDAILAAERARMEAEVRAKGEEAAKARAKMEAEEAAKAKVMAENHRAKQQASQSSSPNARVERPRPPVQEIVIVLAAQYACSHGTACDWILSAAEELKCQK